MSYYKIESKKKYQSSINTPIRVIEYMIIKDETKMNRFILIKIHNESNDIVGQVEFEITQFNIKGESIRKATYLYKDLDVDFDHIVVPQEKIKIDDSCVSIKAKLLSASSMNKKWIDEVWIADNSIKTPINKENIRRGYSQKSAYFSFPLYISFGVVILFTMLLLVIFTVIIP